MGAGTGCMMLLLQAYQCVTMLVRLGQLTPPLTVESMFQPLACSMALWAETVQGNSACSCEEWPQLAEGVATFMLVSYARQKGLLYKPSVQLLHARPRIFLPAPPHACCPIEPKEGAQEGSCPLLNRKVEAQRHLLHPAHSNRHDGMSAPLQQQLVASNTGFGRTWSACWLCVCSHTVSVIYVRRQGFVWGLKALQASQNTDINQCLLSPAEQVVVSIGEGPACLHKCQLLVPLQVPAGLEQPVLRHLHGVTETHDCCDMCWAPTGPPSHARHTAVANCAGKKWLHANFLNTNWAPAPTSKSASKMATYSQGSCTHDSSTTAWHGVKAQLGGNYAHRAWQLPPACMHSDSKLQAAVAVACTASIHTLLMCCMPFSMLPACSHENSMTMVWAPRSSDTQVET